MVINANGLNHLALLSLDQVTREQSSLRCTNQCIPPKGNYALFGFIKEIISYHHLVSYDLTMLPEQLSILLAYAKLVHLPTSELAKEWEFVQKAHELTDPTAAINLILSNTLTPTEEEWQLIPHWIQPLQKEIQTKLVTIAEYRLREATHRGAKIQ